MNAPTGQYCPPSIGMVAAFKLESLAGIVGIRMLKAAGDNRHGHRDGTMILLAFRPERFRDFWKD